MFFTGCKSEAKKEVKKDVKNEKIAFSLHSSKNKVNWTAYKTTKKVGVKGSFKKINITANENGTSIKEAINNAEFSIPVSSVFTANSDRDSKIMRFFFRVMDNTAFLTGKLILETENSGNVIIVMNGVTSKVPFTYTITNNKFSMNGIMNLANWNALPALSSLNKVCGDLHKGEDGVSKTWEEVALQITCDFN